MKNRCWITRFQRLSWRNAVPTPFSYPARPFPGERKSLSTQCVTQLARVPLQRLIFYTRKTPCSNGSSHSPYARRSTTLGRRPPMHAFLKIPPNGNCALRSIPDRGRRLDDNFLPAAPLRRSLRRLQNSELLECSRAVIEPDLLRDSTTGHAQHRRAGKAHLAA